MVGGRSTRTVSVAASHDGADGDGHGEARRHAPEEEADHGAGQADEDGGLAAERVGRPAPGDGGEALGDGEDGAREAGPGGDLVLLDAKARNHLGEVGGDRRQSQRLGKPGDGCVSGRGESAGSGTQGAGRVPGRSWFMGPRWAMDGLGKRPSLLVVLFLPAHGRTQAGECILSTWCGRDGGAAATGRSYPSVHPAPQRRSDGASEVKVAMPQPENRATTGVCVFAGIFFFFFFFWHSPRIASCCTGSLGPFFV